MKDENIQVNLLNTRLASVDWNINISDVQQYWNMFEHLLINVVDEIVPMAVFEGNIDVRRPLFLKAPPLAV